MKKQQERPKSRSLLRTLKQLAKKRKKMPNRTQKLPKKQREQPRGSLLHSLRLIPRWDESFVGLMRRKLNVTRRGARRRWASGDTLRLYTQKSMRALDSRILITSKRIPNSPR